MGVFMVIVPGLYIVTLRCACPRFSHEGHEEHEEHEEHETAKTRCAERTVAQRDRPRMLESQGIVFVTFILLGARRVLRVFVPS
jgi:hypothetical protein